MESTPILDSPFDDEEKKTSISFAPLDKFILLSVLSFGLYELWWMYKAWKFFEEKEKSDISPAARTIFGIFFLFTLFSKIKSAANSLGGTYRYPSILLYFGVFVANFLARLPDPYWLVSILSFLFLIFPVNALNYAVENTKEKSWVVDQRWSTGQIILLLLGSLLWILILLGLFL